MGIERNSQPDEESLIGTQLFGTVYTLKIPLKVFLGYKMCQKVVFLLVIPRRERELASNCPKSNNLERCYKYKA